MCIVEVALDCTVCQERVAVAVGELGVTLERTVLVVAVEGTEPSLVVVAAVEEVEEVHVRIEEESIDAAAEEEEVVVAAAVAEGEESIDAVAAVAADVVQVRSLLASHHQMRPPSSSCISLTNPDHPNSLNCHLLLNSHQLCLNSPSHQDPQISRNSHLWSRLLRWWRGEMNGRLLISKLWSKLILRL